MLLVLVSKLRSRSWRSMHTVLSGKSSGRFRLRARSRGKRSSARMDAGENSTQHSTLSRLAGLRRCSKSASCQPAEVRAPSSSNPPPVSDWTSNERTRGATRSSRRSWAPIHASGSRAGSSGHTVREKVRHSAGWLNNTRDQRLHTSVSTDLRRRGLSACGCRAGGGRRQARQAATAGMHAALGACPGAQLHADAVRLLQDESKACVVQRVQVGAGRRRGGGDGAGALNALAAAAGGSHGRPRGLLRAVR